MAGSTNWVRVLADVPTWAIEDEMVRRREEGVGLTAVAIGDLLVDPVANTVVWRGTTYVVYGRKMEVLWALAVGWLHGRRRIRAATLMREIWRGWEQADGIACLRMVVHDIRASIPGLIPRGRQGEGYFLGVPPTAVARRVGPDAEPAEGAA